jgi:transcription antitermination protein NusB
MKQERRLSRSIAMQLLYQWELQGLIVRKHELAPDFVDRIDLESLLGHFLHNFYAKDKLRIDMPFITDLVKGTVKNIVTIDELIDKTSTKWKLSRMDAIDRAILRIACYELAIKRKLSIKVVINEAIEIARRFGSDQSPAFVNGILDSINTSCDTQE